MLINTFIHLPGIGLGRERALWNAGVLTWTDLRRQYGLVQGTLFPEDEVRSRNGSISSALEASFDALERGDIDFFAHLLPRKEHYRIALSFPTQTAFLDIETTGLSHYYDHVTVVGVSMGDTYFCHVKGESADDLEEIIRNAKCIVTFNGTIFDLKFLKNEYPTLSLPQAHIDLRFFARRAGLSGGQKLIEKNLGILRNHGIEELRGEQAPLLWHRYRLGDLDAARSLIMYNHADVEGMKDILDIVLDRLWQANHGLSRFNRPSFSELRTRLNWTADTNSDRKSGVYVRPYHGSRGPKIDLCELISDGDLENLRVVGIDLTGSERRPTGWCLLAGSTARTLTLSNDADIIGETIKAQPTIVSIDSPLSLPRGRTTVDDGDPYRSEGGIMRECERELKRRGVNVYPCLIPSMQSLTRRGMRLAEHFRCLGIPVIESYPGAAQDIMAIPRKRAGIQYLARGLGEFGIEGRYLTEKVSHDELDAITSAAVGFFFWAGQFEALGNDDEDYLIIPDLERSPRHWKERRVIGISGAIAAGKTTGARHIEQKGFAYGRYSQVLGTLLMQRREEINRENLQALGEEVNKHPGQRWLCQQLVQTLPKGGDAVIDGLRWRMDHAYLIERFGPAFFHIHINASESIRRKRYVGMGNSARDFDKASNQPVESETCLLSTCAHAEIRNEASLEGFTSQLARVIRARFSREEEATGCR